MKTEYYMQKYDVESCLYYILEKSKMMGVGKASAKDVRIWL